MDGTGHHEMFWEVVTSMWIGNAMLLVINLLLIGLWVRLLQVPYRLRFPAIVLLCCIGMYSVNNQPGDIVQVGVFGLIGYLCCKLRLEPAPLLLGFILGPLMEENPHRGRLVVKPRQRHRVPE